MIENAWHGPVLKFRNPVPSGAPVYLEFGPELALPPVVLIKLQADSYIWISDSTSNGGQQTWSFQSHFRAQVPYPYKASIDPRSLGKHDLAIRFELEVSDPATGTTWLHPREESRRMLSVVPGPPADLVEKVCNPDLEERSKLGVTIETVDGQFVGKKEPHVGIQNNLDIAVSGRVEAAEYEGAQWSSLGVVLLQPKENIYLSLKGRSPHCVRLVPDSSVAMEWSADINRILGCPVEWKLIPGGQPDSPGTYAPKR